jgi:hypothetical protein
MSAHGGGLVGVAWSVELDQKGEKAMGQLLWQLKEGLKLLADCRLKGAKAEGFVPRLMFAEFRGLKPFLRHFEENAS